MDIYLQSILGNKTWKCLLRFEADIMHPACEWVKSCQLYL